jgi:hypothetical protein
MELQATKIIKQGIIEVNDAKIGYVNSPEDKLAGIVSSTLSITVLKTETGENMVIVGKVEPTPTGLDIQGIVVHDNGKVAIGGQIFVQKKEFATHEAANAALESGEEYYLAGDNNVFRKL